MICYKDMTFCISPNCENKCGRKLTREIQAAAELWWNPENKLEEAGQAPIAVAYFCGNQEETKENDK